MTNTTTNVSLGLGNVDITLDDSGKVIDFATNKTLKILSRNPEEAVRQWYEKVLVNDYGYTTDQIDIEVSVQMGSSTKKANIVVYEDSSKTSKLIIVETKSPNKRDGVKQLQSYLEATGTKLGVWTNGNDISYWFHDSPQEFEPIGNMIRSGQTIDDIGSKKLREELIPARDLVTDFKAAEQYILAHQGGVDVFDEIFKLIFAKIYDEKRHLRTPKSEAHFRAGVTDDPENVKKRMDTLFDGAKGLYSDVFSADEKINLNGQVTKWIVMLLQNYILSETDMDVLGVGFEVLVNPKMKSDKGQYFTPRQVVRTAVEMLQIDETMKIIDPVCGSGGFLIYSMERVWKNIDHEWASQLDALAEKLNFAQNNIFGTDYDERLVRVAKAYMAIWGDGRAHIYHVPCGIKYFEWQGEVVERIQNNSFDALLTNPPFAGDLSLQGIANRFDLGCKNGLELTSQRKDILFIERAIDLVKSSENEDDKTGLIAIVLPKGDLDEREKNYVRDHILENTKVLAVIALHEFSFIPFTSQKTSLLILKKMPVDEIPEDYDIYMAVSERPGKNKSGNLIYIKDDNGNIVLDEYQRPKLNTDLFDISQEFISKQPNIGYWVKRSELVDRLNAEFYHPKFIAIRDKVTKGDSIKLGELLHPDNGISNGIDISSISYDGKRHYSEDGLPYIRVGDVKENEIDLVGAEKIDPDDYDTSRFPELNLGDILITRKGTTGRAAVVSDDREKGSVISYEIILLKLKEQITLNEQEYQIDPFYVAAFINSFYGKQLILQKQTGGISQGINHPDLCEIEIPLIDQVTMDTLANKYKASNMQLKNSKREILEVPFDLVNQIG